MTDWGLKISKAGTNVLTGVDSELLISSKFPMFKVKKRGTTNLKIYKTTLSANIDASVTTIPLTSTTGFPTSGWIWIKKGIVYEAVSYTTVGAGNVSGGVRGYLSTTPTTHNSGDIAYVGYNEFSESHGLSYPPVHFVFHDFVLHEVSPDSTLKNMIPEQISGASGRLDAWVDTSNIFITVEYNDENLIAHVPTGNFEQYDFVYYHMYDSITAPYY